MTPKPDLWNLYVSLPGWQKSAMERAREAGGQRSLREWLTALLDKRLSRYREES